MNCRFCKTRLEHVFCDLGHSPPSNDYVTADNLNEAEVWYPLKVWTCSSCFLTQIDEFKSHADIFSKDYAYFSSFSTHWLAHAKAYVDGVKAKYGLGPASMFVEVASNDGYLLQYVKQVGIPCLGIEPTASTAKAAREKGIETRELFFGADTARQLAADGFRADMMAANNVLAHVPNIVDFLRGFEVLLKEQGVATFEFPHLLQLVLNTQFDTIYHEHFSYLSLLAVERIASTCGLKVIEVEELATHGGSLRVHVARKDAAREAHPSVAALREKERAAGMDRMPFYAGFQAKAEGIRLAFLSFVLEAKRQGKTVAAYGAAAKGNTLLNFCGVRPPLVDFVCDASPHKQGMFLPGSHIPILAPSAIEARKPDIIVILPWNLRAEIAKQLGYARGWGARFVVAIPELEVF